MYSLIHKKIEEANVKFSLFEETDSVLVALSGGADSVALLLSLKEFYPEISLYACHVNHMLRAEEADRDMEFVKELCDKNGICLEILKTDVGKYALESGLSTELAARNVRYGFFEEICKKHGINKVATAHTLSDNAETVLFNLTRGTGISGLCGIPPKRALSQNIDIIRPLIFATRADIENYLLSKDQSYVIDSTNLTDDYTRNYFRHKVIPLLKEINPSFEDNLKNTCILLRNTQIFIENNVNNNVTDNICELALADDFMLSSIIVSLYKKQTGSSLIERVHVEKIAGLIKKCHCEQDYVNHEVCLPGKISAFLKNGKLSFGKTVRNTVQPSEDYCVKLEKGVIALGNSGFAVAVSDFCGNVPDFYSLYSKEIIDKTKICGELYVRNRKNGDTIHQGSMTKKVKELFNHSKVASEIRNTLPFICDNGGIICIPGVAVSDSHKKGSIEDNNRLVINIYRKTT